MENSKKISSSHFYVYNEESNNRIDVLDSFSKRLAALDVISGNRVLLDDNCNKLLSLSTFNGERCYSFINCIHGNDIAISYVTTSGRELGLYHYHYDEKSEKIYSANKISDKACFVMASKGECENGSFVFETYDANKKPKKAIYSFEKKERVSPLVEEITFSQDDNLFIFNDSVIANNNSEITNVIGIITSDGIMYNGVFDESLGKTREIDLNSHPNYMQYESLKRTIARELDDKDDEILAQKNRFLKKALRVTKEQF